MIPLDLSSTSCMSSDDKSLPSPLRPPTDFSSCSYTDSTSTSATRSQSLSQSSSSQSACLHRTLRPRLPVRRTTSLTSWSVRRRLISVIPTVPNHVTPDLPQLSRPLECHDEAARRASAAGGSKAVVVECRPDVTPSAASASHDAPASAAAAVTGHQIPADPRCWSRDDVAAWLREMSLTFNMAAIDVATFPFNGKAMCLMLLRPELFLRRVPRGGQLLFREFQTRLLRAIHAAGTVQ
jgi:hypothetical protein